MFHTHLPAAAVSWLPGCRVPVSPQRGQARREGLWPGERDPQSQPLLLSRISWRNGRGRGPRWRRLGAEGPSWRT